MHGWKTGMVGLGEKQLQGRAGPRAWDKDGLFCTGLLQHCVPCSGISEHSTAFCCCNLLVCFTSNHTGQTSSEERTACYDPGLINAWL